METETPMAILGSTILKLQQEPGAKVYRVSFPAFTFQGATIPAYTEFFASKSTADRVARERYSFNRGTVDVIDANRLDWFTGKEKTP
jgi:hypothetical protein